jgi:hypothetical protein
MSGSIPGGYPTTAGSPPTTTAKAKRGPGHFDSPGDFIKFEPRPAARNNRDQQSTLIEPFGDAIAIHKSHVGPGSIVFAKDQSGNTRVDGRISVVMRRNVQASLTCFHFCKHPIAVDGLMHKTHRRVEVPGSHAENQGEPASIKLGGKLALDPVEIELSCSSSKGLQPNIYLNCEEVWNIDSEVHVLTLGTVAPKSFDSLIRDICQLFQEPQKKISGARTAQAGGRDDIRDRRDSYLEEEEGVHRRGLPHRTRSRRESYPEEEAEEEYRPGRPHQSHGRHKSEASGKGKYHSWK